MQQDFSEILRCPNTKTALIRRGSEFVSFDGDFHYPIRDEIHYLLPETARRSGDEPAGEGRRDVRDYYETEGWEVDSSGQFGDTKAFVDTRSVALEHTRKCMRRLGKYFQRGGPYLLDAGCGAVPHDEYIAYGDAFAKRLCVDFSAAALRAARTKIGSRGHYIQGDLTNLPLQDNTVDAITCNHVLYHVPEKDQASVLNEFWRVLKPGGVAVVVYAWNWSPIAHRLRRLASLAVGEVRPRPTQAAPNLRFEPQSLQWFEAQHWPFAHRLDTFRLVDNGFMQHHIGDGVIGRLALSSLFVLQQLAPEFCGRYGQYPAIVITK